MVVLVLLLRGVGGLVQQWQVHLGKVDELHLELAVPLGKVMKPLSDGRTHSAGPRACDDNLKLWHVRCSSHFIMFTAEQYNNERVGSKETRNFPKRARFGSAAD